MSILFDEIAQAVAKIYQLQKFGEPFFYTLLAKQFVYFKSLRISYSTILKNIRKRRKGISLTFEYFIYN
jgi:hypothetical protein